MATVAPAADVRFERAAFTRPARVVLVGAVVGLALAAAAAQVLSSQLYEVGSLDPLTFLLTPVLLLLVAVTAAAIPARRAVRVDPAVALRADD